MVCSLGYGKVELFDLGRNSNQANSAGIAVGNIVGAFLVPAAHTTYTVVGIMIVSCCYFEVYLWSRQAVRFFNFFHQSLSL